MSGCAEDILLDLSEPVEEPTVATDTKVEKLLDLSDPFQDQNGVNVLGLSDSVELFRESGNDTQTLIHIDSPLRSDGHHLLDISVKSVKSPTLNVSLSPPYKPIDTETFDFDLSSASDSTTTTRENGSSSEETASKDEEEEEVFFGPVGFKERLVSTVVKTETDGAKPIQDLNSRQWAEIFKEANAVASRISTAAGVPKNQDVKDKLKCTRLKLDRRTATIEPVGSVAKSVENIDLSDSSEKEKVDSIKVDISIEGLTEAPALVDILAETRAKPVISRAENDQVDSPSKRHVRSGTFTISKTTLEEANKSGRKSLPVVGSANKIGIKSAEKRPVEKKSGSETKKPVKRQLQQRSRLSDGVSKLQGPSVKKQCINTSPKESKLNPKSRLSGLGAAKESTLPSKMKMPGAQTTNNATTTTAVPSSSIPSKSIPQKSGIPGRKGLPVSKLQLMKPSGLQRPSTLSQAKGEEGPKRPGPMKAFNPAVPKHTNTDNTEGSQHTSVKESRDEVFCTTKNGISAACKTPNRTGSAGSFDSPMSSVKKRRSFLPTPNKSRSGSNGSPTRNGSTSSVKSRDSPLVTGSRQRRPSAGGRSTSSKTSISDFDDSSPSAMKPRKPLVTNTPNLPKRKISPWSPVIKQKLNLEDQAIVCTKKQKR